MGGTAVNHLKTVVLLSVMTGVILGAGYLIAGQTGVIIALVVAGIGNVVGLFMSDKIAIAQMQAEEVGPEHELYRITERLAQKAGMPMPRVYVSPHAAPNAFATGRGPKNAAVCATAGLLQVLDKNEVAGVMAHELAHVKHRDILIQSVAATIGGAINFLGQMFMFGQMFGGQDDEEGGHPLALVGGLLLMILGPIAAASSRWRSVASANTPPTPKAAASPATRCTSHRLGEDPHRRQPHPDAGEPGHERDDDRRAEEHGRPHGQPLRHAPASRRPPGQPHRPREHRTAVLLNHDRRATPPIGNTQRVTGA
jgi:MFS family permease